MKTASCAEVQSSLSKTAVPTSTIFTPCPEVHTSLGTLSSPGQTLAALNPSCGERSPSKYIPRQCIPLTMAMGHAQLGAWSNVHLLGLWFAAKFPGSAF